MLFSQQDGDETTKKNKFEAKFLIGMCKYLISRGYSAQEITILTTYNGQMQQLFNERKQYDQLRKVRITVVDNFQGEDNKIILLSLVRSNTSNSVGYMAFKNRICVALSRAKVGLYVVGNMSLLAKNCKTWREIQTELESQEAIGDELSLSCSKQHVVKVESNFFFNPEFYFIIYALHSRFKMLRTSTNSSAMAAVSHAMKRCHVDTSAVSVVIRKIWNINVIVRA